MQDAGCRMQLHKLAWSLLHKLACWSKSLNAVPWAYMKFYELGLHAVSWDFMQFLSMSEQLTRISQCLFVLNSFGLIQWIANNNSSLFYKKKGYYKWWFLMQGLFTLKGIESLPVLALMPWAEQHPSKLQFTPTRTNFNSFIKMFWIIRSCITLEGWSPPLFSLVSIPHISALIGGWGQVARGNIESRSYWFNIKSDLNPRAHSLGDLIILKHVL